MSEYRFKVVFTDAQRMRRFGLAQPVTKYKDVEYVKGWLADIDEGCPELVKYIVETCRLIVETEKEA